MSDNFLPTAGSTTACLGKSTQAWVDAVLSGALKDPAGNAVTPAALVTALAALAAHVASTSNPHGVTATQANADAAGSAATVQGNLDTHAGTASLHPQTASALSAYTAAETDSAISAAIQALVGTSPSSLDTLGEIADALNNDASFAATITQALAGKAATDVATTLANGLMASTDKAKLDGIASGATNTPLSSATPAMNGTGAAGSSTNAARADHVHPTDTSRAAASHTHTASQVSDSTSYGRAVLTAASYAAIRTLLSLGGASLLDVGIAAGTVAAGNDSRFFTPLSAQQLYYADNMDLPLVADWSVNNLAPLIQDPLNNAIAVREFVYSAETGAGLHLWVPTGASNLVLKMRHRLNLSLWVASTAKASGALCQPTSTAGNGYIYECTTAGTSGSSAPSWPTTVGSTVSDGGAVWTCRAASITRVRPKLYYREEGANADVPSWSSYLLPVDSEAFAGFTNRRFQIDTVTIPLSTLSMSPATGYQIELTRSTGESDDTVALSWYLHWLRWEFS